MGAIIVALGVLGVGAMFFGLAAMLWATRPRGSFGGVCICAGLTMMLAAVWAWAAVGAIEWVLR